jgi:hypothetical protein
MQQQQLYLKLECDKSIAYENLLDHKRQVISTTKHEAFSSSSEATD